MGWRRSRICLGLDGALQSTVGAKPQVVVALVQDASHGAVLSGEKACECCKRVQRLG